MRSTNHTISISVEVQDRARLRRHAENVYVRQNRNPASVFVPKDMRKAMLAEWRTMRKAHAGGPVNADLMMIFDPGLSPPGVSIIESAANDEG